MTAIHITLAGTSVPEPLTALIAYSTGRTGQTVDKYDLATPGDPNVLTSDEITTTRQIHSRITNVQRDQMVKVASKNTHLWSAIPKDANSSTLTQRCRAASTTIWKRWTTY